MLMLIGPVPGDFRRELQIGRARCDALVLPTTLSFTLGGNAAKELEGLVVCTDLFKDAALRKHDDRFSSWPAPTDNHKSAVIQTMSHGDDATDLLSLCLPKPET